MPHLKTRWPADGDVGKWWDLTEVGIWELGLMLSFLWAIFFLPLRGKQLPSPYILVMMGVPTTGLKQHGWKP